MKKIRLAQKFLFILFFFIALFPGKIFALAAPVKEQFWCNKFSSRQWSYDSEHSNVDWEDNGIILPKTTSGSYQSSGAAWTHAVSFSEHIYSLYLSGSYYEPTNTQVKVYVSFDNDLKEYLLNWNTVYQPKEAFKKVRLKVFLGTNNNSITPKVNEVCLKIETQDRSERGLDQRDDKRARDLQRVEDLIEKYFKDFGKYPVVVASIKDKERQWEMLKSVLISASYNYRRSYDWGFVDQPIGIDEEYQYGYLTNNSGTHYILWTKLENTSSRNFSDSWQGNSPDLNCQAPIYCLSSFSSQTPETLLTYFENNRSLYIRNAQFVRIINDSKVWFQVQNRRLWLKTPEIFAKAGGKWEKVSLVTDLKDIPLLKFIKQKNKDDIYLVNESGSKRYLPNSQILSYYGSALEITVFDDSQIMDLLPNNYLIKAKNAPEVYLLDQNIKRWVSSPEAFEKMGLYWDDVVEVDPRELDYYPEGTPLF